MENFKIRFMLNNDASECAERVGLLRWFLALQTCVFRQKTLFVSRIKATISLQAATLSAFAEPTGTLLPPQQTAVWGRTK